jgi:hypothetical protein
MRNDDDPTAFIFDVVGTSSQDGPIPLKELFIQVYEKWDVIMQRRGVVTLCPLCLTEREIDRSRQQGMASSRVCARALLVNMVGFHMENMMKPCADGRTTEPHWNFFKDT